MKNLLISIAALLMMTFSQSAVPEMIVNDQVIESQITREEAKSIFLFYRKFWDKSRARIVVVLPPPNSLLFRKLAVEELNISASDYLDSVRTKIDNGTANPIFAETEYEVIIKVSNTPYSIGYYYGNFKINTGFGIKTLAVQ